TQDQRANPTLQQGASSSLEDVRSASEKSLATTVRSHQQAVAIDQLFAHGAIIELDRHELDDANGEDFNADVEALFGDPFDLGLNE
ncbi:MAG: hypothetical protein QGF59_30590, partial [Pirellulaceae bacterium]|nr:hypothetical protein [Pirellulaceae bacterium]